MCLSGSEDLLRCLYSLVNKDAKVKASAEYTGRIPSSESRTITPL